MLSVLRRVFPVKRIWRAVRRVRRLRPGMVVLFLFFVAMGFFSLLPLTYTIANAFKPLDELFTYPPRFFVRNPTMANFRALFASVGNSILPYSRYIWNSIFVTVVSVSLTVLVTSMAAYALSKMKMRFAGLYFNIVVMALMFSPHVLRIPIYLIVDQLKMLNTNWSLILPQIAVAMYLFMVKQFIDQFPDVLLEAAKVDGGNEFHIFFRLVLPNLKPAIATLVLFSFVIYWTDGLSPMIYITNQSLKTLPIGLQSIGSGGIGRIGAAAASALLAALPPVAMFLFMQTKVVETMTYSGIKS